MKMTKDQHNKFESVLTWQKPHQQVNKPHSMEEGTGMHPPACLYQQVTKRTKVLGTKPHCQNFAVFPPRDLIPVLI